MKLASPIETKIRRLFTKACAEYQLLEDGDKVLVAVSGGKDSLELVRLLGLQQRIYKPRISVSAVHVIMDNIPYESDRDYLLNFCKDHDVELEYLHTSFIPSDKKPNCFLCSWNRRKAIFEYAVAHGFNKVALGHHQDDIIITLLMNMTFEGSIQAMPIKKVLDNYTLTIIRPLCLVPEYLIANVAADLNFLKQKSLCPYETVTKRKEIESIFRQMEKLNPEARFSLWNSMKNYNKDYLPL